MLYEESTLVLGEFVEWGRILSYRCFFTAVSSQPWLFSEEFPMDGTHTKMNENNATIFIPIRVFSYPCLPYPWLFS